MKTKLFKIGSLLYYKYSVHREMSNNSLWLFDEDFRERSNNYLAGFGVYEHYKNVDLRLYVGSSKPSEFEARVLKTIKNFEVKCLTLGLVDHIKENDTDIASVNALIKELNKPIRVIDASLSAMILNEFCSIETGV